MTATARLNGDELIAKRFLSASPGRVWEAFTTPTHIAAFWGGSHATVPADSVEIDLKPGGEFALDTQGSDGTTRRLRFVYRVVDPPQLLVFDEPVTGLRTTVSFEPEGDGTHLTIHQQKLPSELQTTQAAEGLTSILDALAKHLGDK